MKTLLFSAAIISASIFTSCNNETLISEFASETNSALSLNVSELAYTPTATGSRAVTNTDAVKTTEFEEGDALGLFIISEDGTVTKQNVKFTYTSGIWTPDGVVNYYANSNYIAYFPYEKNLTVESSSNIETVIKTYFTKNNFTSTDQSSKEAYQKADLMMAKLENPKDPAISFPLKHQFSMVEISIPVRKYITTKTYDEAGTRFEYCAPHKVTWKTLTYNDTGITPYYAGNGVYRYIAVSATGAADVTISITGNVVYDENGNIMNFDNETNKNVSLSSGSYVSYNLKNPAIPSDVTERDLEVGDYYYSDGSIYPYGKQNDGNDLSSPLTEGCIGVIYDVENANDTDGNIIWNHGFVLALSDADGTYKWDTATLESNILPWNDNFTSETPDEQTKLLVNEVLTRFDGYKACWDIVDLSSKDGSLIPAIEAAVYFDKYLAPEKLSSGWYLPSVGQVYSIMNNLGDLGFEGNYKNISHLFFGGTRSGGAKKAARNNISNYISRINVNYTLNTGIWKLVTEISVSQSWAIEWADHNIRIFSRSKGVSEIVHPVLSF